MAEIIDTIVKALKNLCATIKDDGSTWKDIPGTTIVDVINQITIAKGGGDPSGELSTLTVTSVAGSTVGTTKITVKGNGSGQLYYKTGGNVKLPIYHEDVTNWSTTTWDGKSDITATDGEIMCIVEVDENNLAVAGGSCTVNVKTQ